MRKLKYTGVNIVAALLLIVALAVMVGCGSKEKAESTATEKATTSAESQSTAGEQKTEAAPETQQAVDWSAYSNPKAGVCPVCQMNLEPAYVEVATIAEKKYACCSSRCVAMLSQNPDQYLSAAASAEESHEGHGH